MERKLDGLPVDLLVSIVRLVSLKDAIRMSAVSKNLKSLYGRHLNLDFDASITDPHTTQSHRFKDEQFIRSVTRVLKMYKEPFMDSFRVCFPLSKSREFHGEIDSWVKFVVSKGVMTLELDFMDDSSPCNSLDQYRLPYSILSILPDDSRFNLLKSLCLKRVTINCEHMHWLLSKFIVLERLHVEDFRGPMTYAFASKSLKFLVIKGTYSCFIISIDAVNLVQLEFRGVAIEVDYLSAPKLAEVSFGGNYCDKILNDFSPLVPIASHISKLGFDVDLSTFHWLENVPTFAKVTDLALRVTQIFDDSHFSTLLYTLFEACPSLQNAKIETDWLQGEDSESIIIKAMESIVLSSNLDEVVEESRLEDLREWLHDEDDEFEPILIPNLQSIEWRGAFRSQFKKEYLVALCIVKSAIKLEKLVFDPRSPVSRPSSHQSVVDEEEHIARENARELAAIIPKHIETIIL